MDYFRIKYKKQVESYEEDLDLFIYKVSFEDILEKEEVTKTLLTALEQLPTLQKKVIYQLKFEEKSIKEIAHNLNLTEVNVKISAHRGYKKLRKILENSPLILWSILFAILIDCITKGPHQ